MSQLLKNEIISWLKPQPYWLQYAGNLLLDDMQLTNPVKLDIYKLLLEDNVLKAKPTSTRPPVVFTVPTATANPTSTPKLLTGIKDVENVNALAPGQQLPIGPGLTIVYGNNGAGKSGYIRLLNNAFNSRGDASMPDQIADALQYAGSFYLKIKQPKPLTKWYFGLGHGI